MYCVLQAIADQGRYTQNFTYDCISPFAKSRIGNNVTAAPCVAPTSYNQGSALAVYNSTTFYDDLIWAASWMYYASGTKLALDFSWPCCSCLGHYCLLPILFQIRLIHTASEMSKRAFDSFSCSVLCLLHEALLTEAFAALQETALI